MEGFLRALGSFRVIWGVWPHPLEPVGRSGKFCCRPAPRGGPGLAAVAPVASSGYQERAGEEKDLRLGLTKGEKLDLVPKGLIWDQTGGLSDGLLCHPLYSGHLEDYFAS